MLNMCMTMHTTIDVVVVVVALVLVYSKPVMKKTKN